MSCCTRAGLVMSFSCPAAMSLTQRTGSYGICSAVKRSS